MRKTLLAALASAGLLVACGGGSDAPAAGGGPVAPVTTATVALSGTAAKGLMANADVGVHAVNADGSIAATARATTTTLADGSYSLSFTGTQGRPYVVRVSAKADGSTSHTDEVSGQPQPLPANFLMRSLVVPATTGAVTTSASVTPFSEMAVAAAAKATGGVSAANAAQAVSTVTQLLGFNPTTVLPTKLAGATGADRQKLAVMLTAVSQLAASGDLGCASGSAGEKTQCVVAALGAAASKDSIKLGDSANDVSAKLAGALTTVLSDDKVRDKVDVATLTNVVANLGCTSCCTAAPVGATPAAPSATALAIAAAKLLFAEIKTDWSSMFSPGGASPIAGGAVNVEAHQFQTAMQDVQAPVEMLAKDLGTLLMDIDLYNDYKAGRTGATGRGRGDASLVANDGSVSDGQAVPAGCTLYQDANTTVTASSPANANFIGCGARFYVTRSVAGGSTTTTELRHGFTVTPVLDGSFDYAARARRRVTVCTGSSCTSPVNAALQVDAAGTAIAPFTGKLSPVLGAAFGSITSFTLVGDLPAAFKPGSISLVGHKHVANLSGTQTLAGDGGFVSTLQGSLAAQDPNGGVVSTLTVKSGSSLTGLPAGDGAGALGAATLNLVLAKAGAEFEGLLSLTDPVWDKSHTTLMPTKAVLSGALRNRGSAGSSTEFLNGVLNVSSSGFAEFDTSAQRAANNSFALSAGFVGTVTASNRPTLEFSLGSSWTAAEVAADLPARHVTLQYRTLRGGVPKLVVALTGDRNAQGGYDIKLSEAVSNLSMAWTGRRATVDLLVGDSNKIGSLATGSGLLTFVDGSFISLDIGL